MTFPLVLCGLGLGVSLFLLIYGIKGGLIEKKMLNNVSCKTYDLGPRAVTRGWFYIIIGVLGLIITIYAFMDIF